eukprot:43172-Amphidinium_carterae.1
MVCFMALLAVLALLVVAVCSMYLKQRRPKPSIWSARRIGGRRIVCNDTTTTRWRSPGAADATWTWSISTTYCWQLMEVFKGVYPEIARSCLTWPQKGAQPTQASEQNVVVVKAEDHCASVMRMRRRPDRYHNLVKKKKKSKSILDFTTVTITDFNSGELIW